MSLVQTPSSPDQRQNVLVLWLAQPALDARVVAWSEWYGDGTPDSQPGSSDVPPYTTGVGALRDGWRLFSVAPLRPEAPGFESRTSYPRFEFWFEQIVTRTDAPGGIE